MEGQEFAEGDVLVTDMTDPDREPIMKKASAIVTNKGGRTCHAAMVAREMGVHAIVGCGNATTILSDGDEVTACCSEGHAGIVYEGKLEYELVETKRSDLPEIDTALMLNVASPSLAFRFSRLAQFLVEQGIDSVSVTPDSVIKTIKAIHCVEQELKQKQAKSIA